MPEEVLALEKIDPMFQNDSVQETDYNELLISSFDLNDISEESYPSDNELTDSNSDSDSDSDSEQPKKRIKYNKIEKLYCKYCKEKIDKNAFNEHIKEHENAKINKCVFENCNEVFHNASALRRHMQLHEGISNFSMPIIKSALPRIKAIKKSS